MPRLSKIGALVLVDLGAAKGRILDAIRQTGTVYGAASELAVDPATLKRLIARIEESAPGFRAEIKRVRKDCQNF